MRSIFTPAMFGITGGTVGLARFGASGNISVETPATLTITTASVAQATVSVAYSATLAATGGTPPYTWSEVGSVLSSGVSLTSAGVVTGTPSAATTLAFTARVTDDAEATADATLTLTITAASSIAAFYTFNPDDYADTTALFADSLVVSTANAGGTTELATAPGTPPWGGTKCVKSTYLGGMGNETQAGAGFTIENADSLQLTEIWARTWIMWDDDFTTNGPGSGNPDQKVLFWFMQTPSGSDRVEHNVGVFGSSIGHYIAGNGINTSETMDDWWDGDWHEVRMHLALGQSPGSTTTTWTLRYHDMDKTYTYGGTFDDTGFSGDYIAFLNVFANLNKGSSSDISCYHGPIEFYSSNPGWGI